MSNELRQAAERLRVSHHQEKGCPWESSVYESLHPRATIYLGDCWRVVNAYLAEHPADDDEPVTCQRLVNEGFSERPFGRERHFDYGDITLCQVLDAKGTPVDWKLLLRGYEARMSVCPKTMSQVRRLIAALKGE